MSDRSRFVPAGFEPPVGLELPEFVLEPLEPRHNDADYAAWTSSIAHIRATPGFEDWSWPHEMPLAENLADLERHARDFAGRKGFTYTVLDPVSREVIGCVYIYPARESEAAEADAAVRSWVRVDRAGLDIVLWRAVSVWLRHTWPFERPWYAPRA